MQLSLCLISICAIVASYVNAFPIEKTRLQVVSRDLHLPEAIVSREIMLPNTEHSRRSTSEADHQYSSIPKARGGIDKATRRDLSSTEDTLQARNIFDEFKEIEEKIDNIEANARETNDSEADLLARSIFDEFKEIEEKIDSIEANAHTSRRETTDSKADLLARSIFDEFKEIEEKFDSIEANARETNDSEADLLARNIFDEFKGIEEKLNSIEANAHASRRETDSEADLEHYLLKVQVQLDRVPPVVSGHSPEVNSKSNQCRIIPSAIVQRIVSFHSGSCEKVGFVGASDRMWWLIPTVCLSGLLEVMGWAARLWSSFDAPNSSPFEMQITCTIIGGRHSTGLDHRHKISAVGSRLGVAAKFESDVVGAGVGLGLAFLYMWGGRGLCDNYYSQKSGEDGEFKGIGSKEHWFSLGMGRGDELELGLGP
ncbi:hypothetical protein GALMADRAFT_208948 [Galerina marginata CBS 339.88]|uniref:Uncharacterized protein n=1 Tax=Galerina marginata (strain CBS 339.88) TaxID=685588 RepID=A0A067T8X6_GALM3|nr:hypothetical protein GALMADRAFT_208948 [Galerina marginata CBS 339.88]